MLKSEKRFIDQVLKVGGGLPKEVIEHHPKVFIRALRRRLRMTQGQLAKRVKMSQSYIAKVESGSKKPTLETLERIFRELHCSLTFLLISDMSPDKILEQQAYAAAQKRVKYVAGTMALEEQLPSKESLQEMLDEEKQRLLDSRTTKIWD